MKVFSLDDKSFNWKVYSFNFIFDVTKILELTEEQWLIIWKISSSLILSNILSTITLEVFSNICLILLS